MKFIANYNFYTKLSDKLSFMGEKDMIELSSLFFFFLYYGDFDRKINMAILNKKISSFDEYGVSDKFVLRLIFSDSKQYSNVFNSTDTNRYDTNAGMYDIINLSRNALLLNRIEFVAEELHIKNESLSFYFRFDFMQLYNFIKFCIDEYISTSSRITELQKECDELAHSLSSFDHKGVVNFDFFSIKDFYFSKENKKIILIENFKNAGRDNHAYRNYIIILDQIFYDFLETTKSNENLSQAVKTSMFIDFLNRQKLDII